MRSSRSVRRPNATSARKVRTGCKTSNEQTTRATGPAGTEEPMPRKLVSALIALLAAGAAQAEWALNMPEGVTELSKETYDLHMLIFWVCVWIGVAVFGVMIYSIFAHRQSKGAKPANWSHSTAAEIVWTAIPVFILLALAVPTARTLIKIEDTRDPDLTIVATGYQWKWHYQYQDEDMGFYSTLSRASLEARRKASGIDPFSVDNYLLDVDNPVVVPVNKKVRVLLTSNDVLHAWWIPEFAVKRDAIPGMINEINFKPTKVGTYRGQCAELCGADHGYMPIVVEVVDEDAYTAWVETRKADDAPQLAAN